MPKIGGEEHEDRRLRLIVSVDRCPDCQQCGFLDGPHGGIDVNLYCMNRDCRSAFNVSIWRYSLIKVQRIGKARIAEYD